MEETTRRKLHPTIEILLITVFLFIFQLIQGFASNLILTLSNAANSGSFLAVYTYISSIVSFIFIILATLICAKVIEKRAIHILVLCLIALGVGLVSSLIGRIFTIFISRFGIIPLRTYSYVSSFIFPVIKATLITLFVNLFDKAHDDTQGSDNVIYCSLPVHILLLLFTFGIWNLVWIYRVTQYLNCVRDEEYRNPTTKLLLYMFLPFYPIYWTYKSAQRIDKLANSIDLVSDLAVACLILEFFIPIIPPILMQDKINNILTNK